MCASPGADLPDRAMKHVTFHGCHARRAWEPMSLQIALSMESYSGVSSLKFGRARVRALQVIRSAEFLIIEAPRSARHRQAAALDNVVFGHGHTSRYP